MQILKDEEEEEREGGREEEGGRGVGGGVLVAVLPLNENRSQWAQLEPYRKHFTAGRL